MSSEMARRYRFAPAGKPGLFGSIPPAQIAVAATGAVAAWLLTLAGELPPIAAVPGLVGLAVAFNASTVTRSIR